MNENQTNERRTRVIFNLPISNDQEELAVSTIISYLQLQRLREVTLGGFTFSQLNPGVFRGYWWSSERQGWVLDEIALFIVDYLFDYQDPVLVTHLRELKQIIRDAYRFYGSIQDEIWIVSHRVLRYI